MREGDGKGGRREGEEEEAAVGAAEVAEEAGVAVADAAADVVVARGWARAAG